MQGFYYALPHVSLASILLVNAGFSLKSVLHRKWSRAILTQRGGIEPGSSHSVPLETNSSACCCGFLDGCSILTIPLHCLVLVFCLTSAVVWERVHKSFLHPLCRVDGWSFPLLPSCGQHALLQWHQSRVGEAEGEINRQKARLGRRSREESLHQPFLSYRVPAVIAKKRREGEDLLLCETRRGETEGEKEGKGGVEKGEKEGSTNCSTWSSASLQAGGASKLKDRSQLCSCSNSHKSCPVTRARRTSLG